MGNFLKWLLIREWQLPRDGRVVNAELLFNGYKVSVLEDEEFCSWMVLTATQ